MCHTYNHSSFVFNFLQFRVIVCNLIWLFRSCCQCDFRAVAGFRNLPNIVWVKDLFEARASLEVSFCRSVRAHFRICRSMRQPKRAQLIYLFQLWCLEEIYIKTSNTYWCGVPAFVRLWWPLKPEAKGEIFGCDQLERLICDRSLKGAHTGNINKLAPIIYNEHIMHYVLKRIVGVEPCDQ